MNLLNPDFSYTGSASGDPIWLHMSLIFKTGQDLNQELFNRGFSRRTGSTSGGNKSNATRFLNDSHKRMCCSQVNILLETGP